MIVAYEELLELVRRYPNSTKYEYVQDCQYRTERYEVQQRYCWYRYGKYKLCVPG